MSNRYKGGVISATPPTLVAGAGASGTWTLEQQMQANAAGLWPVNGPFYIEDVFSTYLYTGNGTSQSIVNGIDVSTYGGMTWIKNRSIDTGLSVVHDTARGTTQRLSTNLTDAQVNLTGGIGLTAFNTNGFTVGTGSAYNGSGNNLVSWTFREQPKFFDVVTYTGDGTSPRAISHSLGSAPGCVIIKQTNAVNDWCVWHTATGNDKSAALNLTDAFATFAQRIKSVTSTTFTVGNSSTVNDSGATYVAYLFAHNAGGFGLTGTDNVISCGSYTGNGASNGQLINLGYEAQWVMIKNSSSGGDWWMLDTMRGWTVNGDFGSDQALFANASSAESGQVAGQPDAQGFRPIQDNVNASGNTYIYIAIRRGPMKVPTSGTSVFSPQIYTGTNTTRTLTTSGFPIDLVITDPRSGAFGIGYFDRLRGATKYLNSAGTGAEGTGADSLTSFASMDGYTAGADNDTALINYTPNYVNWLFRRAPSFFDEVCYTGTGSVTTFSHNLGVVPELMIVKRRSAGGAWMVNSQYLAADARLELQSTSAVKAPPEYGDVWNNTRPTSTVFTVSTDSDVNASGGTYVNYLFATCAGVSKVGSYTGTATTLQVDCGFTNGARFVLIKRTDSTGDWYVWDSARGIVAGNDPYLLLNSTAAEVTNTDYVDTYSAGFEISSTAPAAINASGGTYIFLAIA